MDSYSKMEYSDFDVIVRANAGRLRVNWRELWRYRDLVRLFVKRNFTLQFKQTLLGPLWLILNPLLSGVMFTVVFGQLAGLSTDGIPQFLFYLTGSTMWSLFAGNLTGIANTFINDGAIMSKVYFPRLVIPISRTVTSLGAFGIQFAVLLCFYSYYLMCGEITFSVSFFLILPLVLQCALLGLGAGIILSSMTTRYRDLSYLVGFGIQIFLYATPVAYPFSTTGGIMRTVLLFNPMTSIVENFRYALLGGGNFLEWGWLLSCGMTVLFLVVGIALFNRVEKSFADTI